MGRIAELGRIKYIQQLMRQSDVVPCQRLGCLCTEPLHLLEKTAVIMPKYMPKYTPMQVAPGNTPPDPPGCMFCNKQEPDCKCFDMINPKKPYPPGKTVMFKDMPSEHTSTIVTDDPVNEPTPVCSCTMAELLMFGKLDNRGNCSLCGGR